MFSPTRFSALPGLPFRGDGGRRPHRGEAVGRPTRYARHPGTGIRARVRVEAVGGGGAGFGVRTADGARENVGVVLLVTGRRSTRPHGPAVAAGL